MQTTCNQKHNKQRAIFVPQKKTMSMENELAFMKSENNAKRAKA
jgi:hypothetical protein